MRPLLTFFTIFLVTSCSQTNSLSSERDLGEGDVEARRDLVLEDTNVDLDGSKNEDSSVSTDSGEDSSLRQSNAISIQQISTRLETDSISIPLTSSENALPFLSLSYQLGDPTLRYLHVDSNLENGKLILSRSADSPTIDESISISGQVVGFDPGRIKVQCMPFRTGTEIVNISVDPVRIDQTFISFWSKIATGSNNKDVAFMSVRFNSNSEITLERVSPAGTVVGHLCLSEAVEDAFTVQHMVSEIAAGKREVLIPLTSIDLSRSIVFVSHQATRTESKPGYSQISCELQKSAVRCIRGLNENEISDLRVQVVSFKDRTNVSRFHVVIEDGVKDFRLDLPGVNSENSVVFGPIGVMGEVATNALEKPDVPASHVEAIIEDGGIRFNRGEPWTGRLEFFPQVISW